MAYKSPLRGKTTRTGKYGNRPPIKLPGGKYSDPNHRGVDLRAAVGTPVYPTVGGKVVQTIIGYASSSKPGRSSGRRIFSPGAAGNLVVVRGDDGIDHNYGHLDSVAVKVGQRVETTTRIAYSGRTGVTAAHLHYGMWREVSPNRWVPIDPTPHLPWDDDVFGELRPGVTPPAPTPAPPALTPEQQEETELAGVLDQVAELIGGSERRMIARMETLESRLKRATWPEPIYVQEAADGTRYDFDTSPWAALHQPSNGFVFPLDPAPRQGQLESQRTRYRLVNSDANPVGLSEHAFFGTIADSMIGAGRLHGHLTHEQKHAAARALFTS